MVPTLADVQNRILDAFRPLVGPRGRCLHHGSLDKYADMLVDISIGEIRRWERLERPDPRSGELWVIARPRLIKSELDWTATLCAFAQTPPTTGLTLFYKLEITAAESPSVSGLTQSLTGFGMTAEAPTASRKVRPGLVQSLARLLLLTDVHSA